MIYKGLGLAPRPFQDLVFSEIRYSLDKNYQSLKEINTQTGNALIAKRISYPDVRNIKVRNGEVYYLHAPFEPTGNVFLFKENIK